MSHLAEVAAEIDARRLAVIESLDLVDEDALCTLASEHGLAGLGDTREEFVVAVRLAIFLALDKCDGWRNLPRTYRDLYRRRVEAAQAEARRRREAMGERETEAGAAGA